MKKYNFFNDFVLANNLLDDSLYNTMDKYICQQTVAPG